MKNKGIRWDCLEEFSGENKNAFKKFVVDNIAIEYKRRVIQNYIDLKEGGRWDLNPP